MAQIDGVDVKLEDLGEEMAQAENRALRTYCGEVARGRGLKRSDVYAALERVKKEGR